MKEETVTADDLVKDLTNTTEPVFTCRDKTVSGPLDLRHRTIPAAVDLQGCHFQDEVDLTYCTFEQTVDLTGCNFDRGVNSTGKLNYPRPFHCKKDFTCDNVTFDGPVNFGGARIEGGLSCDEGIFNGPTSFNDVRAERIASFANATFAKKVDFIAFRSGGQINYKTATFHESVCFNSLKCEGAGFFNGATFGGDVDLGDASFDSVLEITGATFNKAAWFGRLQCRSLNASYDKEHGATTFNQTPTFDSLKCDDAGSFNGAVFKKGATFTDASFGSDLDCSWDDESDSNTDFGGPVTLYALKCGGDAQFNAAQFKGTQESDAANFSFSRIGGNLVFADSSFSYPLNLEQVDVSRGLDLTAKQFREISLYNATIEVIALTYEEGGARYTFPPKQASLDLRRFTLKRLLKRLRGEKEENLQFGADLDLRGLTFNRFKGSKEDALQFARAQKPTVFSLDPYVQIEEYYEKVGMDVEARDVHYEGQHAMRRNSARSSEITWTFGRKTTDSFLRVLTGYGVRTSRVAWVIVFFLLLGALVFSMGDLAPLEEALGVKTSATSASSAAAQNLSDSEPTVMDQISYSVDRFIPINMGVEDSLEPRQPWSEAYTIIHVLAGWLLIPLFLASWSGLVRSRR